MEAGTPNNTDPLRHDEPPRKRESTLWGWSWEILAMVVSLGCTVSVVAILAVMKDRPLTDWQFFLSIPATVAIFGTALKSTAAFAVGGCVSQYKWLHFRTSPRRLVDLDLIEEAGRGPLGSLVLLARRPMGLASIAAAVTLLALALETFVQQTVQLNPRDVAAEDGLAVLGLAHTYNGGAQPVAVVDKLINVRASTADTSMQGAVYRGLFNLGSPTVFSCASRCTWNGTYVSLGFAGTCTDVKDATLRRRPDASKIWNNVSSSYSKNMTLITPGDVPLDASFSRTSWQTVVSVNGTSSLNISEATHHTGDTKVVYMAPDIARIGILRAPVNETDWYFTTDNMEIFECQVGLAAYTYSNLSSTGNNLAQGTPEMIPLDRGILTFKSGGHADMVVFNQTGLPVLQASVSDIVALQLLFTSTRFGGNIYDGETAPLPSGMGDAFRLGNISQAFQGMVDSMTNQLRASYNVKVQGLSINQVVFVEVEWPWLTLPFVVQFFSAVFLIVILVQSAQTKSLPLWKSSTTAVLTYDVRHDEEGVGRLGTGVLTKRELNALGNSVETRLELPEQMVAAAAATTTTSSEEDRKPDMKVAQSRVFSIGKERS